MKNEFGKLVITRYKNNILSLLYNERNEVEEICCDAGLHESLLGNIYVGRVANVVNSINAAFIEFSPGRMGYFSMEDEPDPIYVDLERKQGPLRAGDVLIVQVIKDAQKTKEPVLSSNINLTGKYVVLTLNQKGLHFSSKFKDTEKKKLIRERYETVKNDKFGFIIRTNSEEADIDDIFEEIDFYSMLWLAVRDCGADKTVFSLLYPAPKSYLTSIRDGYDAVVSMIVTDDREIYEEVKQYLTVYQNNDLDKLVFYDNKYVPLKVLYNVEKIVANALDEKVYLRSGGYLYIQPTEALVSIDVNTGRYVSKYSAQEEYLKVNLEAAEEIARQIRLRNLSGIIIVDFINMKIPENRQLLMKTMEELLSRDPQKTTLVDMTRLNLVEITRKKGRRPLYELIDF